MRGYMVHSAAPELSRAVGGHSGERLVPWDGSQPVTLMAEPGVSRRHVLGRARAERRGPGRDSRGRAGDTSGDMLRWVSFVSVDTARLLRNIKR